VLVPPDADRDAGFDVQFLQDMLDVLLDGAWAAPENFADLGVALPSRDPFHDLKLALGQGLGLHGGAPGAISGWVFF